MRAARLVWRDGVGSFQIEDHVHIPTISEDEILIRVRACSVSNLDLQVRRGVYSDIIDPSSRVIGFEISGEVAQVGSQGSNQFKEGDEVICTY